MSDILTRAKEEQAKKLLSSGRSPAGEAAASTAEVASGGASGTSQADKFGSAVTEAGTKLATNAAQQGDGLGTVGGALMMAGGAKADPYLMAGGLGLTVLGAGEANKRKEKEAQRQAYNERIKARQQALNNIANIRLD